MPSLKKYAFFSYSSHMPWRWLDEESSSDEKLLLLWDANTSDNLDFLHELLPEFSLYTMQTDECKAEFRFEKNDIPIDTTLF